MMKKRYVGMKIFLFAVILFNALTAGAETGVTNSQITIGMTTALSGPA